jgi:SAM-dependent methyltransferase
VAFAKEGFTVTGVDRSAFLLGRAGRHAEAEGVEVEWVEADMRDFRRESAYDLAVSLYTAFGYFEDAAENLKVLENVRAGLAPGGKLVLDVLGKETLAPKFQASDAQDTADGGVLFQRRTILDDWSRLRAEWTLVRNSTVQRFTFTIWIYSGFELKRMLEDAGFAEVRLYGHLDGRPYDLEARRLVAVATKGT